MYFTEIHKFIANSSFIANDVYDTDELNKWNQECY